MNRKKNNTPAVIFFAALICILYIILAIKPLSTELHLTPEWTSPITDAIPEAESLTAQQPATRIISDKKLIPFKLKQNLGYFTEDGEIVSAVSFPYKSTISESYYTYYTTYSSSFTVFDKNGEESCTIKAAGYPYIQEDRIYLMLPGGTAFAKYDANGSKIFQYESYAPITAFSSSANGTVAGFADGHIVAFNNEGHITQNFIPGGSNNNIILGADISDDGTTIACITGQDRQRFIISKQEGERSKIIYHEYMDEQFQNQTLVKFHGNSVFYNYKGGLGSVELSKMKSAKIPLAGAISQIEFIDELELGFVLSKNNGEYSVGILESYNNINNTFSYKADSSFIQTDGNKLFVGKDNKISCITISRR